MQPFLLLVPALCAGFVYSAAITFVDFENGLLANSRSVSIAGAGGGTTTYVVVGNNIYTGARTTITTGAPLVTNTVVEDASGLRLTTSLTNGIIAEESCSWDSASTTANCVVVGKGHGATATVSGVYEMATHTFGAAVTNAPSATNSGSSSAPTTNSSRGSAPTTNSSSGGAPTTNPSSSASANQNGATSIALHYQWAVLLLGGVMGVSLVW